MTDDSHLLDGKDKKKTNWIGRLLKIAFVLIAFFLVMITVLANMGGNSKMLKDSIAGFISEVFRGRPVDVLQLNNISFFPNIGVDVEGINVLTKPENGIVMMHVGKARMYMSFWNVATRNQSFRAFYLQDISTIKGVLFPNEFYLEKLFIDHDIEAKQAVLRGNGKIGTETWRLDADVNVIGSAGKYSYRLSKNFPFTLRLGDIALEGNFVNHVDDYFKLQNFTLTYRDSSLSGDLVLSALGKHMMKVKANLGTAESKSVLSADLIFDTHEGTKKISGKITSERLDPDEFSDEESVWRAVLRIRDIFGYSGLEDSSNQVLPLHHYDLDLDLDLNNVAFAQIPTADYKFPLIRKDNHVRIGSLFLIPHEKDKNFSFILHDMGAMQGVLKRYFPHFPDQAGSVECGMGTVRFGDADPVAEMFVIETQNGRILIKDGQNLNSETRFGFSEEKQGFGELIFDDFSYEFLLSGAEQGKGCLPYILRSSETF